MELDYEVGWLGDKEKNKQAKYKTDVLCRLIFYMRKYPVI